MIFYSHGFVRLKLNKNHFFRPLNCLILHNGKMLYVY